MRARGDCGALRVCYQRAAVLGAWTLEQERRLPASYLFRAQIVTAHDFWITQRPIDLVLAVGTTEWLWRDVALIVAEGEARITVTERPIVSERPMPEAVRGDVRQIRRRR